MLTAPPAAQDTNVFVSEADAGTRFDLKLGPNRQAYLVCIDGSAKVGGGRGRDGEGVGSGGGVDWVPFTGLAWAQHSPT